MTYFSNCKYFFTLQQSLKKLIAVTDIATNHKKQYMETPDASLNLNRRHLLIPCVQLPYLFLHLFYVKQLSMSMHQSRIKFQGNQLAGPLFTLVFIGYVTCFNLDNIRGKNWVKKKLLMTHNFSLSNNIFSCLKLILI